MGLIAVKGVSIHRRGQPVLAGVDLTVPPGERLGLLGRSGTGKTSLLRVIAGLDSPTAGWVEVAGRRVTRPPAGMTMVFQGDAVYDHLVVERNLVFSLTAQDRPTDLEARIRDLARRFFLTRLLDRPAGTLSSGERRALSAARAVARPGVSVVLLDDPLEGTDQQLRHRLVENIIGDPDLTVVFASREGVDALRWADRVAVLSGGVVAQFGDPMTVFRSPASLDVAESMGELNRIPATVSRLDRRLHVSGSRLDLPGEYHHLADGRRVIMGVRPSDLSVPEPGTSFSRRLRGTIGRIEPLGATQRVSFGLGRHEGVAFGARIPARYRLSVGDRVDWSVGALRVYDAVGGAAL